MKKEQEYKTYDELPLCLKIADVAAVMGICLPSAYELANRADFPAIRVAGGKRIVVPRDRFLMWLLKEDYAEIMGGQESAAEHNTAPAPIMRAVK